ncbi:MAG TPA: potassium/proton antiporter [Jiangellaceae bacterium]
MDVDALNNFLLIGALVLIVSVAAVRASVRIGLPSLVLYLLIGVLLGEAVLGIEFEDARLAQALAFAALVVILAEGGLATRWDDIRPSLAIGVSLATVGVAVTTTVVALVAHFFLGLGWKLAILVGAVFAPTDAAAVFSTLRRVPLKRRVASTLEAESGLNDAPTVVLVTVIASGELVELDVWMVAGVMAYQLIVGVVVGLVVGRLAVALLRRAALPALGLYPLTVMTFALLAYVTAAMASASGFASVYVAALILGNSQLPHRAATRSFAEGLAWLAQIGLFVMLGLLASPSQMPGAIVPAVAAGAVLLFVARPLAVLIACLPFRLPWRELMFLSWAGLLGAVPVVLATIALAEGVERSPELFAIVFVVSVILTVVQAPTLPWVARKLDVGDSQPRDADVESAPLDRLDADLVQLRVPPGSKLHGVEVGELRLPVGVSVGLIVRDERSFVPDASSVLRYGDDVLIVAPRHLREATEKRLRAVGRHGRLARWISPDTPE